MQEHQIHIRNVIMWVLGMVICPLGVTLSAKAGFGVSMIEAPVYVTYLRLSQSFPKITFGTMEYILQALVLILLCILVKKLKPRYLLSFGTAVLFGLILDGWRSVLGTGLYENTGMRIFACAAGIVTVAFAIACFFRTDLPQEVWELFVKEYSEIKGKKMTKVKWIYDITSLTVGIILMLTLLHKFEWTAIGIGTIVTTIVNAPLIGLFGKLIDRVWKDREGVKTPFTEQQERKALEEAAKASEDDEREI